MTVSISRRTALALAVGLPIVLAKPAAALQPARLTLPASTGRHRVASTSMHLVDASRPDPWVPTQPFRELMIQLWYPAGAVQGYPRVPWMTPGTARAYEQVHGYPALDLPITDAYLGAPAHQHRGGWPVVLYSHGLGGNRAEGTALVEDLASHGYVVVTIDHVHDADVVEFPDGRVETSAMPPLTDDNEIQVTTKAIESRVADVRFVLDQLHALPVALDLGAVGMFGQSDGGATTAHAVHVDRRITAGVNLDGTLWTPEAVAGSDRPFLLFGRQDLDPREASTWAAFRANQRGPQLQLNLTGAKHLTFTDLAVLLPQAASALHLPPDRVAALVGTINGQRAIAVQRAYVRAFFGKYLRRHDSPLLTGPSPRYPEVQYLRSTWTP
ncbi:alpha/beta hydrolase family protein [Actinocrispum wychmicini]|uniref:Dienelactone hydrolase n=1 Tax=Actinocrispum wychmicini TaxID=1213861 RepID=A0A4R2IXP6_9PSEU|nr:hydrolase [Actinocrispum wychmicini]TCO49702.1 dienelactone hydrolase [Actinocrispum wychmicini]